MPAATLRPVLASLPHLNLRGALGFLAAADARYRARLHLRALDDRILRDIGVSRAEIEAEARRPGTL